tara:strand:- start:508 stop:2049 length:1542 start_codon:yes stop_codon:yes gene_type:complete
VALGLIVAYWDDIKGAVDGTTRSQREGLAAAEKMKEVTAEQLAVTNSMENTLKLQGKTEKEIRDLKVQQTNEIILATEAQLAQQESMKKTQIEAAERNRNIAAGIIAFLTLPIGIILGSIDAISQTLAQLGIIEKGTSLAEDFVLGAAEMIFDPEEVATEADATIKETEAQLRKLKNSRDGFLLKDKDDKKKKAQEDTDNAVKAEEDRIAALEAIRKGEIDTEAERRAEKLRLVNEEYEELKASAIKYGEDTAALEEARLNKLKELKDTFKVQDEAEKLAEQEKRIQELSIDKETDQLSFDEQRALIAERRALTLEDQTLSDEQKLELKKEFVAKETEIDLAQKEAKADIQNATLDVAQQGISVLKNIAGENVAVQKALLIAESAAGIAKILVNTGVANAKAVAAVPVTGGQPFVAINSISAGLGIAGNIAATAKGLSALGGGSPKSGGSVPKSAGGGSQPPSFNIVGASETNQLADAVAGQANQPVQAYVVANDVSSAQSLERNIVQGATID